MQVLHYFHAVPVRKQRDELSFFLEAQAEGWAAPSLPGAGGERPGGREESSHFGPGSPERFALTMGSKVFRARCDKTMQKEKSSVPLLQPERMRFKVGGNRGKVTDAPAWCSTHPIVTCFVEVLATVCSMESFSVSCLLIQS